MRPFLRLPLRRYVHSIPPVSPPHRARDATKVALGASLAFAGYVSWKLAGDDRRIALDASSQQGIRSPSAIADTPPIADSSASSIKVERETVDPPTEGPAPEKTDGEEEEGEAAYNPVTGEINWDCPCLGGMAHGPCGLQFREAFSCFIFSEQEPKGIDCVEKFKNMQDCFRAHPDIYGEEIADDEDDAPELSSVAGDKPSQPEFTPTQPDVASSALLSEAADGTGSKENSPRRQ